MKHRLFTAIDLPEAQKNLVFRLVSQPSYQALPVSWQVPEKLHLTLNFIGKCDEQTVLKIQTGILGAASRTSIFKLQLSFLDCMYRRHAGGFVYLGPSGDMAKLFDLQKSIAVIISNLSIPQPVRYFPHILIGKLIKSDPVSQKRTMDQIRSLDFTPLEPFIIPNFTLFESLLSKAGSVYKKFRTYPLSSH